MKLSLLVVNIIINPVIGIPLDYLVIWPHDCIANNVADKSFL